MKLFLLCLTLLHLQSCSSVSRKKFSTSRKKFSTLQIGMTKEEVNKTLGSFAKPSYVRISGSGNGENNHVYEDVGYLWYNEKGKLKGFSMYDDIYTPEVEDTRIVIERARGYSFSSPKNKKAFILFQPYSQLKSDEAQMIFLQNKKNIQNFLHSKGYTFTVDIKKAKVVIIVKLGISDPKTEKDVISTPTYRFKRPKTSTTNYYGGYGNYLGSAQTKTNPYSSYEREYDGQNTYIISRTEYFRSLELVCIDNNKKKHENKVFWSAKATSKGSSDDLRYIFPYLFYATSQVVEKSVTFSDYLLANFHTGVREMVKMRVPKTNRLPSSKNKTKQNKKNELTLEQKMILNGH